MLISGYSETLPPTPAPSPFVPMAPIPRRVRPPKSDLVGRTFEKLTVVEWLPSRGWRCRCWCGALTTADTKALLCGRRVSCGCWRALRGSKVVR